MNSLVPIAFLASFVVVPLLLVVLFVSWRSGRRRARIRKPWSALADKLGGQFHEGSGLIGTWIRAQRPTHALTVRMELVSVMEAARVPFYPDGGTYTEVLVDLPPQDPALFTTEKKVQTFKDHMRIPALAHLGRHATIFLEPKRARIVFPGVVDDYAHLEAAAHSLEGLTGLVMQTGPLQAAS